MTDQKEVIPPSCVPEVGPTDTPILPMLCPLKGVLITKRSELGWLWFVVPSSSKPGRWIPVHRDSVDSSSWHDRTQFPVCRGNGTPPTVYGPA